MDSDLKRNSTPVVMPKSIDKAKEVLVEQQGIPYFDQHNDEEDSIKTVYDEEVTPFPSQTNEVRDIPDHVSDSLNGYDSTYNLNLSNSGCPVRVVHSAENIPFRVARDLSNLKDRWADIVGDDPPPNDDLNVPKDGFEVVLTKSQNKKLMQKKKTVVQSDYTTRSRVGKQSIPQ